VVPIPPRGPRAALVEALLGHAKSSLPRRRRCVEKVAELLTIPRLRSFLQAVGAKPARRRGELLDQVFNATTPCTAVVLADHASGAASEPGTVVLYSAGDILARLRRRLKKFLRRKRLSQRIRDALAASMSDPNITLAELQRRVQERLGPKPSLDRGHAALFYHRCLQRRLRAMKRRPRRRAKPKFRIVKDVSQGHPLREAAERSAMRFEDSLANACLRNTIVAPWE
jgi:hypothetical protein